MESSNGFMLALFLATATYVGWNVWREWGIPTPPTNCIQAQRNAQGGSYETCK
jgi:cytochrome c-type biogenesis protein CcmH/NrfG